jgi:uncharacterized membrane protein YphA (DoxX/SURF4 family)
MQPGMLRRIDNTGVPLLLARLVLGVVMIQMGWAKVGDPVGFLKLLREYELLPAGWYLLQNLIAVSLPWIEVVCGISLILGLFHRGSSLALLLLLTGFTIAIAIRAANIHAAEGLGFMEIHFDCGCGGGDVYVWRKIPENIGLWLLAAIGLLSQCDRFTVTRLLRPQAVPAAEADFDAN